MTNRHTKPDRGPAGNAPTMLGLFVLGLLTAALIVLAAFVPSIFAFIAAIVAAAAFVTQGVRYREAHP